MPHYGGNMARVSFKKKANARTGNILFQYLFAKTICIRFGHTYVPFEEFDSTDFLVMTDETDNKGVVAKDRDILCDGFFQDAEYYSPYRKEILAALSVSQDEWTDHEGIKRTISDLLVPSKEVLHENDVVVSLRLDDFIQYPRETSDILDPRFYLSILETVRPVEGRLILVCDKTQYEWEKRYMECFQKWSPRWTTRSWLDDFALLRDAPTLIHSNSSFCWVASFLSSLSEKKRWIPCTGFYAAQNLTAIEPGDMVHSVKPLSHNAVHALHLSQFAHIYPLSYSIPDECIVDRVPEKHVLQASLVPGDVSTYMYGPSDEQAYHQMYRDARFAITRKKGGWDCLRHYEILANGCIPLFEGLDACPANTLTTFPKHLVQAAKKDLLPWSEDKEPLYRTYVSHLLDHVKKHQSVSATAKYVLEKMGNPKRVLLIRCHVGVNYTRELTWVGIQRQVEEAVEYPRIGFLYTDSAEENAALYGNGFTYSKRLDPIGSYMTEADIVEKIKSRYWDAVIYGKVGPDEMWEGSLPNLPLWEHVFPHYANTEIAFFYGGDEMNDLTHDNRYSQNLRKHAEYGMCFVRELTSNDTYPALEEVGYPCIYPPISLSEHVSKKCAFYCVAYNSPERAKTMRGRFQKMGLELHIHGGVQMDDPRLQFTDQMEKRRLASVFYGHLDNIQAFYDTGKPYGLFCEDDVQIRRDLATELPTIMGEFNAMSLDILLLGYMTTNPIEWWHHGYTLVYDGGSDVPYRYHRYPENQWGVHLFMISREYARRLLDQYDATYASRVETDPELPTYNPDWTLSKWTQKRALRYPMMAVEDGRGKYEHWGQGEFHRNSHLANYVEGEFV